MANNLTVPLASLVGGIALFMACPIARGEAPASAAPAPSAVAKKTELLWLGHSAFRMTTPGGKVIVIDPWLITNPKTPPKYKDLKALGKVDLILVSHAHVDHFIDAPALAKMNNVPYWGPAGLASTVQALGILTPELAPRFNKGGTLTPFGPTGVKITAVRAEHSSELVWKNPATGKDEVHVGGEPLGFIIELENGMRIYFTGDTALFGDLKLIADYYKPDVVILPIGGHFVFTPKDAAYAIREWLKPRFAIPIHYGTNPNLKGTPEEFQKALGTTPTKVILATPGEAFSL